MTTTTPPVADFFCRVYLLEGGEPGTVLLDTTSVSTSDDYGYLATSVTLDGIVLTQDRTQQVQVQCSFDETFPTDEVRARAHGHLVPLLPPR